MSVLASRQSCMCVIVFFVLWRLLFVGWIDWLMMIWGIQWNYDRCFKSDRHYLLLLLDVCVYVFVAVCNVKWTHHKMTNCFTYDEKEERCDSIQHAKYRNDKLHYKFIKTVNEMCAYGLFQFYVAAFPLVPFEIIKNSPLCRSMRTERISSRKY